MAWDTTIHYYSCSEQLMVKVLGHREWIAISKKFVIHFCLFCFFFNLHELCINFSGMVHSSFNHLPFMHHFTQSCSHSLIAQAGAAGTRPRLSQVKMYFSRQQMCSQHSWRLDLCTIAKKDNFKGSFSLCWEYLQRKNASDGIKAQSFNEVRGSWGNYLSVQMFIYLLD